MFERKIDFGPGYRIHFGKDGDTLVILLGGSTKQRQQDAIAAALERLQKAETLDRGGLMTLTRDFKETIQARARRDARFRQALFTEAINAYLGGDTTSGKAILRDLVNATVGFKALAAACGIPSKSLHRMLAPQGNPNTENFFGIVRALQKKTHVKLSVTAKAA